MFNKFQNYLNKFEITLKATKINLIDEIWTNRPEVCMNPIFVHEEKFAGESASSKLNRVG